MVGLLLVISCFYHELQTGFGTTEQHHWVFWCHAMVQHWLQGKTNRDLTQTSRSTQMPNLTNAGNRLDASLGNMQKMKFPGSHPPWLTSESMGRLGGTCLFVLIIASCTKARSSERFPECLMTGKRFHISVSRPRTAILTHSKEQSTIDASSFKPWLSSNSVSESVPNWKAGIKFGQYLCWYVVLVCSNSQVYQLGTN